MLFLRMRCQEGGRSYRNIKETPFSWLSKDLSYFVSYSYRTLFLSINKVETPCIVLA